VDLVTDRLMLLVPLVLSLSVHECAHAWTAYRLGDDTAKRQGRLTLDPTVHIDWVGTILLPVLGVPFGWAKPVPVNPARFRRGVDVRTGMLWTSLAGPLSNVALAVASGIAFAVCLATLPRTAIPEALLLILGQMNVGLALFNLLPIPPLDGSRIVDWLVPDGLVDTWRAVRAQGPLLLMGFVVLTNMLDIDLFAWPRSLAMATVAALARALT
jgi:Zn-dependent protease